MCLYPPAPVGFDYLKTIIVETVVSVKVSGSVMYGGQAKQIDWLMSLSESLLYVGILLSAKDIQKNTKKCRLCCNRVGIAVPRDFLSLRGLFPSHALGRDFSLA